MFSFITGKDIIIFVTPEDHKTPSTVTLSADVESEPGIVLNRTICHMLSRVSL